ncbi:hypothetical protein HA498_002869 [Listeria monocytogenes]|nr:hypothetical protein [Listeria monocytogenes]EEP1628272.1 hypothetical protein [Listeria monocytogenes]EEP1644311.1 hypothetical protein [Listeria monocytogenes]EEP1644442.1 hypothetical protein [Listeria monocytogenes]EEP1660939.1 hypothetical protein [Listeria monocytogenes]
MTKKKTKIKKEDSSNHMIKIVYFDEPSANDYITVKNGGKVDWNSTENKEKMAKIVAEIDAEAKGNFNILTLIKASIRGQVSTSYDSNTAKLIENTISNTILTDYISIASDDENIRKFENDGVHAPENSITMYKMFSSYMNIVPKEEIPIDLAELNKALLGERGYYQMLLNGEEKHTCVLRFNINAFKNNYTLADLSKMKLSYFGVKVGTCSEEQLSIEKEFEVGKVTNKVDVQKIVTGEETSTTNDLDVYDIVLAGVMSA